MKTSNPYRGLGKHQANAFTFIKQCIGWHSFSKNRTTVNAITGLEKRGLVIVNEYSQFKVNPFLS